MNNWASIDKQDNVVTTIQHSCFTKESPVLIFKLVVQTSRIKLISKDRHFLLLKLANTQKKPKKKKNTQTHQVRLRIKVQEMRQGGPVPEASLMSRLTQGPYFKGAPNFSLYIVVLQIHNQNNIYSTIWETISKINELHFS